MGRKNKNVDEVEPIDSQCLMDGQFKIIGMDLGNGRDMSVYATYNTKTKEYTFESLDSQKV